MKNKNLIKTSILTATLVALIILGGTGVIKVNSFFENNRLVFKSPVEMRFNQPITVQAREPQIIKETIVLEYPGEIDTPIEQYICDKWGAYDCRVALAVAQAESGMREDAININTNDTIDVGIFQINSVHFKKAGCSIKDLVEAKKNVDCAYQIWKQQGWNPWVAFNSGSFKSHL